MGWDLLPGDAGITQTVNALRQAVKYALANNPELRARAEIVIAKCAERDEMCEASSLLNYVKRVLHYAHDPRGVEFIKSPEVVDAEVSKTGAFIGDCDDASGYLAALLMALGFAVRFVVIAIPDKGSEFRHIYVKAYLAQASSWLALDATAKNQQAGWEAPSSRSREYDV